MAINNLKIISRAPNKSPTVIPGIGRVIHEQPGLDWTHPSIAVKDAGAMGLGLVALDMIPQGTTAILFGGKIMTYTEVLDLPDDMQDIPYQITDELYFGIVNRDEIGIGERINHSCNPNCGFVSEMKLVTIKDIWPGEDVTMDYATCSWRPDYSLVCLCGSDNCRQVVRGTDWQNINFQNRMSCYYQPYLKYKLSELKRIKKTRSNFLLERIRTLSNAFTKNY